MRTHAHECRPVVPVATAPARIHVDHAFAPALARRLSELDASSSSSSFLSMQNPTQTTLNTTRETAPTTPVGSLRSTISTGSASVASSTCSTTPPESPPHESLQTRLVRIEGLTLALHARCIVRLRERQKAPLWQNTAPRVLLRSVSAPASWRAPATARLSNDACASTNSP